MSRSTFYENFPDKETCFLAAFDFGVAFALGQMRAAWEAVAEDDDWHAHVRSDLGTFVAVLASEPAFAWALHVEVLAAGPDALERRDQMMALFTERTRRVHALARKQGSSLPKLAPEVFEIHSAGIDELIRTGFAPAAPRRSPSSPPLPSRRRSNCSAIGQSEQRVTSIAGAARRQPQSRRCHPWRRGSR